MSPRVTYNLDLPRHARAIVLGACIFLGTITVPALAGSPQPGAGDQLAYGRDLFEAWCSNCHARAEAETSFAPTLHRLYGRKPASIAGFDYTPLVSLLADPWSATTLDQWLASLATESPTTSVLHLGVQSPRDRAAIVEYVATLK